MKLFGGMFGRYIYYIRPILNEDYIILDIYDKKGDILVFSSRYLKILENRKKQYKIIRRDAKIIIKATKNWNRTLKINTRNEL